MSEDDSGSDSFEAKIRSIAREVSRSIERVAQVDVEEIAEAIGVDPARAAEFVETALGWVRAQAVNFGDDSAAWGNPPGETADDDRLRAAGPHPLDLPTAEQGRALAALDSGRWTVEPGSHALATNAEGPAPSDALGLVGELRARDWIAADGQVTLAGRHALTRWLDDQGPS